MVGGWVIREDNLVAEQSPVVAVEKQELKLPSGYVKHSYWKWPLIVSFSH